MSYGLLEKVRKSRCWIREALQSQAVKKLARVP
jgi:hypothetical protein